MPKKWFSAEQVVTVLGQVQVEVLTAQGKATPEACPASGDIRRPEAYARMLVAPCETGRRMDTKFLFATFSAGEQNY